MKNSKPTQADYDRFIHELSRLNMEDLLLHYIKAKTGSEKGIDKIPVRLLEAADEIDTTIKEFYADELINGAFD